MLRTSAWRKHENLAFASGGETFNRQITSRNPDRLPSVYRLLTGKLLEDTEFFVFYFGTALERKSLGCTLCVCA